MLGEAFGELERGGAACEIFQQISEAGLEGGIGLGLFVGPFELEERHHERFRDVAAAVRAEPAGYGGGNGEMRSHGLKHILWHRPGAARKDPAYTERSWLARGTSAKKARSLDGSFLPGRDSTPLATSTA